MSQRYIGGLIYNPPGGFSGYFDGSGDRLEVASQTALGMGAGDFTYEAWVYVNETVPTNALRGLFDSRVSGATGCGIYTSADSGTTAKLVYATNSAIVASSANQIPSFIWSHIAVTRSSGTVRGFINGVLQFTVTDSRTFSSSAATYIASDVTPAYFNGYISNARILKGTALYTAAFDPPVGPLQAITNTSLLTCAYGTFRDGSTNNFTITVNGNTAVSTQNPFPQTQLPNPALGNQGNGVYSMSQYQSLLQQNLWPAIDPYWEYVTLMLHGNGTNGAQNNTFLDSSTNNFTITRNGNTTQGTFTPYGDNWSNSSFSGSNYLSYNPGSSAAFGTGDFTVEAWVFATDALSSGDNPYICDTRGGGGAWSLSWNYSGGSNPWQLAWANGSLLQSSTAMNINTWNHCAYVRSGTNGTLYLNGVSIGTWTDNYNYSASVTSLTIGRRYTTTGITQWLPGYLSNFRIVKGTAVYTSAFTPPTAPLTAITNTVLLTCQSNRFIDNSSSAYAITVNGSPSVQRFSPFNPTAPYSAATIGGSGYFDGSGDYLSLANPNTNIGSIAGDFTIECWINWITAPPGNASGNERQIIGQHSWPESESGNWWAILGVNVGVYAYFAGGGSYDLISSSSFTWQVGTWYHVAIVRSGSTVTIYLNGTSVGSGTSTKTLCADNVRPLTIGADNDGSHNACNAYISNMRLVKGTAVYTAAFTPPTAPLTAITNTSLLLNFTNAGIIDNAEMNNLETVGNAQISTAQSKFGGGSIAFDGSGDALALPANANLAVGSGDFTLEMWVYGANNGSIVGGSYPRLFALGTAQTLGCFECYNAAGTMYIEMNNGSAITFTASTLLNSTWNHFAIARSGSSVKAFVNGTQVGAVTNSVNLNLAATTQSWIGAISASAGNFNGYIDDLRITKGYARYTGNFTPQRSQWQDQ